MSVLCGLEYVSGMKLTAVFLYQHLHGLRTFELLSFCYLSCVLLRAQTGGRLRGKGKTVGRIQRTFQVF